MTATDGLWLCGDGPYKKVVSKVCGLEPSLRRPDPKRRTAPVSTWRPRAVVVEFPQPGGATGPARVDFQIASELTEHLNRNRTGQPRRRLTILEGLSPEFVSAIGDYFGIGPTFFMRHERCVVFESRQNYVNDVLPLPSTLDPLTSFCLKYYEPLYFGKGQLTEFRAWCLRSGRHISISRAEGQHLPVSIPHRKCSFWIRQEGAESWDSEYDGA